MIELDKITQEDFDNAVKKVLLAPRMETDEKEQKEQSQNKNYR